MRTVRTRANAIMPCWSAPVPCLRQRIAPADRVLINPFGMGVSDIALAATVFAEAGTNHIGQMLPR